MPRKQAEDPEGPAERPCRRPSATRRSGREPLGDVVEFARGNDDGDVIRNLQVKIVSEPGGPGRLGALARVMTAPKRLVTMSSNAAAGDIGVGRRALKGRSERSYKVGGRGSATKEGRAP